MRDTVMRGQSVVQRLSVGRESGQAVLEFAGGLVVLLLLVVGIIDFAPALVRSAQLSQAVRDGVTYARTDPGNTAEIRARVRRSATAMDVPAAQITVTCRNGLAATASSIACTAAQPGHSVQVTAQFNYRPSTVLFGQLLDAPLELTRSATSEIY